MSLCGWVYLPAVPPAGPGDHLVACLPGPVAEMATWDGEAWTVHGDWCADPPEPYAYREVGPLPDFRTAIHRAVDATEGVVDGKDKTHARMETAHRETPLLPGVLVRATDRGVCGDARRDIRAVDPRTTSKAEAKARAKSAERIEDAIANADRRRRADREEEGGGEGEMSDSFIDPIEAAGETRKTETPATFAARLLANRTPLAQLSPMEKRLLAIIADLFGNCVGLACVGRADTNKIDPLTTEIVVEGARLAVAAAVEIEQHLRGVREHVEARRK